MTNIADAKPEREPDVPRTINQLEEAIERLAGQITRLDNRLQPIVCGKKTVEDEKMMEVTSACELSGRIQDLKSKIVQQTERLSNLTDALEI